MAVTTLGWFVVLGVLIFVVDIVAFWRGSWARLRDGSSGPSLVGSDEVENGLPGLESR